MSMRGVNGIISLSLAALFRLNGVEIFCPSSSSSLFPFLQKKGKRERGAGNGVYTRRSFSSLVDTISESECDEIHDDVKAMERETALRLAISQVASEFGKESMLSVRRFFGLRHAPIVSTGSLNLDLALGIGGLPKGRMVEIYGPEASGKTTLGLHIIKEAQKHGGYCAYIDAENAMDPSLADSIGVNTQNLLIAQPSSAENLLNIVDTLTKSGCLEAIVVDSVAALVPQCELDVMGDTYREVQSRLMTQALRKIQSSLCRSQTLLVFLNQVRSRPSGGLGHWSEVTCGGNALKFYAAVRMRMIRTGLIKNEDEISGIRACVQVVKNKLGPSMTKANLDIRFGRGIWFEAEALEMGCKHGIIQKTGSEYRIQGELLKSKEEAQEYLAQNDQTLNMIQSIIRSHLFENER